MSRKGNIIVFLKNTSDTIAKIIPENSRLYKNLMFLGLKITAKKRLSKKTSMRIDISVVEHCNLWCKHCWTFSPLADEIFMDVGEFDKDFKLLSKLTNGSMSDILLMGGEPLLHPKLTEIMDISRKYFRDTEILLLTNGILLEKQDKFFWESCRKNGIKVKITHYPIKINYDKINITAAQHNVEFGYWGQGKPPVKAMFKFPIDINGGHDANENWFYCHQANNCFMYKRGRIYPCSVISCIEHFNKFFGCKLTIQEDDYIEIKKVANIDEMLSFLAAPKPFCRYCNKLSVETGLKWELSQRDISEWT